MLRTYHERPDGTTEELPAVHEVFYNDEGQVDPWSEGPVWPCGR